MKCKIIRIRNYEFDAPRVLLGIILDENDSFLTIKTRNKCHLLNKKYIISIEDSDEDYDGVIPEQINYINNKYDSARYGKNSINHPREGFND